MDVYKTGTNIFLSPHFEETRHFCCAGFTLSLNETPILLVIWGITNSKGLAQFLPFFGDNLNVYPSLGHTHYGPYPNCW